MEVKYNELFFCEIDLFLIKDVYEIWFIFNLDNFFLCIN